MKKIALLVGIVAGLAFVPAAVADPAASACSLSGSGTSSQPVAFLGSGEITFSFHGTLENCQGNNPETSGTISAGETITIGGVQYFPYGGAPKASGNCYQVSTMQTMAFIQWGPTGPFSLMQFADTLGAFNGQFAPATSISLTRVNPPDADHMTDTFPLKYAGDNVYGGLMMSPDPASCVAGSKSFSVTGALSHYHS